ncbi:glycosyltransferase family A protein, partial [Oleiphilus sp. HI0125]
MIKVSVVMPTYNRADLVGRAVESVLNQTFHDFELIVVDDGSSDSTRDVLNKYNEDKRFRYIFQENQGQSVARNKAIELASGMYLAFLDSDNYWPLDRLEKSVPCIESLGMDYALVYGDGYSVDLDEKIIGSSDRKGHP